ncbi:MAG: glycosyltransferase family 2 protein [Bacteroidetes bacterium]|nr:glycosyltransferase family 2 protein [Bacteroidota bacterium]
MVNNNLPLVSIITVNYNQTDVTCQLLESLRKITYSNIEIYVVDNDSPNKEADVIKLKYPEINLIKSKQNLGFAGGNNLAIRAARGDYFLLINNDTEVECGFLEPLILKFKSNNRIGAVSPKIRYYYRPELIQYAGFEPMSPITIRQHAIGYQEVDNGQYEKDLLTDFAFGAAMLVSRDVINKVGLMADIFFLYYEEMDWMSRIRRAGFEIWYVHNSLVFHKDSITTGRMSPLKTYYLNRGRLLYMRRNTFGVNKLLGIIYQIFVAIPKNMSSYIIKGQYDLLEAYRKALGWHIKNATSAIVHKNPAL